MAESGRIVESDGKRETHETSATRTSMRVGSSTRRSAATRAESGRAAARVSSAAIRTIRVSRGKTSRVSAAQSLVGLIAVGHRCVRWCVRGSAFATSRAHLSQVGVAKTKASRSRKGGVLRTHQFYLTQPQMKSRVNFIFGVPMAYVESCDNHNPQL